MNRVLQNFNETLPLKSNLEKIYNESWSREIESCLSQGKLRVYANFKKSFKLENYLVQFPYKFRRYFTKLRISAHNLAIETGRYAKPIATPIDKRLCFHCKQVENEYHLIFECSLYNSERKSLYDDLSNILSIDIRPSNDTLYLLMSCLHGDPDV